MAKNYGVPIEERTTASGPSTKNEENEAESPASNDKTLGKWAAMSKGGCDLANNRLLTDSTTPTDLYENIWIMSHLENGDSLVEGYTSPSYITYEAFKAFREDHPCNSYEYNGIDHAGSSHTVKLWTSTWFLEASINELENKVTFNFSYVKGTEPFKELLRHLKKDPSGSYARWFYRDANNAIRDCSMKLNGNVPHSAFYPEIDNLHSFYDEYAASSANVLLLIGPPGTGKTTFLRGFLQHCNMNAWVTYDPRIQQDESFIISFADPSEDEDGRVLVLEDCDALMGSRTDGNDLMNRILNLSDGIIQLPKRKLIFSTNLPSLDSVDEALLRPGRCFGAVKFRVLQPHEATKAAASVGLKRTFNAAVTLAQAINSSNGVENLVKRIGF